MKIIVRGKMSYEGLPFPTPSTEVRYFERSRILVEPGSPKDFFRVVYELTFERVDYLLVTHPHLDHLGNAIAFPEAALTRNPKRESSHIGGRWDRVRDFIKDHLELLKVSPRGREELLDDVLVCETHFHYPGHLVFVIDGMAFVGDARPPVPEIEEKLSSGRRYHGELASYMRDVASKSEVIVTAHRGEIEAEKVLKVIRSFWISSAISFVHRVDKLVEELARKFEGKKEIIFNGGLSVSGLQHVGRLRGEVIMNDVLASELSKRGFRVKLYITLYTMDAWKGKKAQRERFGKDGSKYVGRPLIEVPDPYGCHKNRVEHYRSDFGPYIDRFTRNHIEVVRTDEMYRTKRMKEIIEEFIQKKDIVREIINKYRKRKPFPEGWIPFNPQCQNCRRIDSAEALDYANGTFRYKCNNCGHEGEVPYYKGKLNRRLERVAVRKYLGVDFEPYGKDHATPGGSRDSCNELARALGIEPPVGERYERVAERRGKVERDMSSSSFIGFTPKDRLEVARPEVLRFLFLSVDPHKRVVLSLEEIPRYYDRFYEAERKYYEGVRDEETRSYELALLSKPPQRMPVQVPYDHMAILAQIVTDVDEAIRRLKSSGHIPEDITEYDRKRIESLLELARTWAKKYAPERLRIEILNAPPKVEPDKALIPVLKRFVEAFKALEERTPEAILETMKTINSELDKKTIRKLFSFLYTIFLGRPSGPRIANLFAALRKDFVIERIKAYISRSFSFSDDEREYL